ncbi:MAG: hypothetical protein EBU07_10095, partial [Betaproteobacteria bacterium]|nr:hypothetical protein [Betaproteobacteria bacterium]
MKLQPDKSDAQIISGHGDQWVSVGSERITHSVLIGSRGQRVAWQAESFEQLGAPHFELLAEQDAEIVIFGSGARL